MIPFVIILIAVIAIAVVLFLLQQQRRAGTVITGTDGQPKNPDDPT